jgi:hypothetical protein
MESGSPDIPFPQTENQMFSHQPEQVSFNQEPTFIIITPGRNPKDTLVLENTKILEIWDKSGLNTNRTSKSSVSDKGST